MTFFSELRAEYDAPGLRRSELHQDPFEQFRTWLADAVAAGSPEANACVLATSAAGNVTARAVIMKAIDHGFVFFTNYTSQKAQQLASNPAAAMCFVWPEVHRQVRLEGTAERVDDTTSDLYFQSRPVGSQVASAASPQSQPVVDRQELLHRFEAVLSEVGDGPVPRPDTWGGYRLVPARFEFWQGQPNRLHDRFVYQPKGDTWEIQRLAP